jgi:hypothetical protein
LQPEAAAARGYRDATSPHQLGDADMKDPPLLRLIHERLEPAVLVTFDNKLPLHSALLTRYGTTLAIIDKNAQPADLTREEYWREVIHRHAHRMAQQDSGSKFRYTRRQRTALS